MEDTYKIIRFYRDGSASVVQKTGLTLEEAKEHCQDPDSEGENWFDGFMKE